MPTPRQLDPNPYGSLIDDLPGMSHAQLNAFVDSETMMRMPLQNIVGGSNINQVSGTVQPMPLRIVNYDHLVQVDRSGVSLPSKVRVPILIKTTTITTFNMPLGRGRTTSSTRVHHSVLKWDSSVLEGHIPIEQNIKTIYSETTSGLNQVTDVEINEIPYGPPSMNTPSRLRRLNDIMNTIQHISPFTNSPLKSETGTKAPIQW